MTRLCRQLARDERGATLIEMMAVVAILGVLLTGFVAVISTTITRSSQEQESTALQTEARASIDRFSSELRMAYTGVDGTWPVEAISPTSIRFLSPQRVTPFKLQRIEWQVSGGTLQRRFVTTSDTDGDPWVWPTPITSAVWDTRARSIRNATVFQYFKDVDSNGDGQPDVATLPADVRIVQVTLDVSTTGQQANQSRFQTRVKLRVSAP